MFIQVEFKGPGYTSSYNNIFIIIPAIFIVALIGLFNLKHNKTVLITIFISLIGFVAYRLVDSLMSKKKTKLEKARLRQQKKVDRQASPQPSPGKNKRK